MCMSRQLQELTTTLETQQNQWDAERSALVKATQSSGDDSQLICAKEQIAILSAQLQEASLKQQNAELLAENACTEVIKARCGAAR